MFHEFDMYLWEINLCVGIGQKLRTGCSFLEAIEMRSEIIQIVHDVL